MAKRKKSFSHVQATEALKQLGRQSTSAKELVYDLLRIFANWGDGQIRRTKDGAGNSAKDGVTVLIKNLIAYREATVNMIDGDCSEMYDIIDDMRNDIKITKQSPRLYVTSDGAHVVAYDPKENDFYENRIELMWKDFEFFTPLAGIEKIQYTEEAEADVKSAELMAKLFDDIRRYNDISTPETVHSLNIFMSRLLFCFFAEDTGLFPDQNLFTGTLSKYTKADGSDLSEFIDRAFIAMSTNETAALDALPELFKVFPYVNGGLFKERYPIPKLSRRARTLILNCGEYDWKEINPDIFGSMIQAVVTPEKRAGLGMHYTSVTNIEKLIRPLFLDFLIEEYTAACDEARDKIANKMHPDRATQRLRNLLGRLANIKFFDPACGSGNFLIITYKRLRELEILIWQALRDIANIALLPISSISLTQFYGIELDEYACDTATLSLWLAEHQMNVKFRDAFGVQPETLPLKPSGNIVCGNACRIDWNIVCPHKPDEEVYIMGNPPYIGSSLQNEEQKNDMHIAIGNICKGYKKLDYIATWFVKAAQYSTNSKSSFAFVTTNSISQGEQVTILWPILFKTGLEISFAYTSFKWSNNAKHNAGVTVTIIGLANAPMNRHIISKSAKKVDFINAYLSGAENVFVAPRGRAISCVPEMLYGSKPADGGALIIEKENVGSLITNPEISQYIKLLMGADSFINGYERYCIWVSDKDSIKAKKITELSSLFEQCRQFRSMSAKLPTRELAAKPWKFAEVRYKPTNAILIPCHSSETREYIPIGFVDKDTVISNSAFAIYDAEMWLFAVLTSHMHNVWVKAVAGALETRIRYSATLCYNTFPIPKLTTAEKEKLEQLSQNILNIRYENFDMTLGEMYNPETMPDELREAHHQLDLAVERIYRPEPFTSDEERLEHLFKLYTKMIKE